MNPEPDQALPLVETTSTNTTGAALPATTGLWNKIRDWLRWAYQPGDAVYAPWELLVMRLCFAWVVWETLPLNHHFRGQPQPNGVAHFFDLTWMGTASAKAWLQPTFLAALAVYVLGLAPLLSTTLLFVIHCAYQTLHNSQGAIGHSTQIVSLILLGQMLAHFYDCIEAAHGRGAITLGERLTAPWRHLGQLVAKPLAAFRQPRTSLEQWAQQARSREIFLSQQMIALTYVVSGIAKLINSEGKWIRNVPNIALQMVKSMKMDYYSDLTAPPARISDAMIQFIIAYPNWSRLFFSGGLILELFCFVALFNRGIMALWGLGLIMMHLLIGVLMSLEFENNVYVLAIYFVNTPFWVALPFLAWRRRREHKVTLP